MSELFLVHLKRETFQSLAERLVLNAGNLRVCLVPTAGMPLYMSPIEAEFKFSDREPSGKPQKTDGVISEIMQVIE